MINQFATHIPAITWAMDLTGGSILELGVGKYSTPLIVLLANGRCVTSLEWDPEWYYKFMEEEDPKHVVTLMETYDVEALPIGPFGVVFIDHEPPQYADKKGFRYTKRMDAVEYYKDKAEVIIVHDTEDDWFTQSLRWRTLRDSFHYTIEHRYLFPWTTLLSDTIDLGSLHLTKGKTNGTGNRD